jgi:hypothetical protein
MPTCLVFEYDTYYPVGGMNDLAFSTDEVAEFLRYMETETNSDIRVAYVAYNGNILEIVDGEHHD